MTRARTRVLNGCALAAIAWAALVPLGRPIYLRWGSTDAELAAALPGDELAPRPDYQVQHAVTIHAPADQVWPWLAQIGQDRGGFYSYSSLENLIGLHIRNANLVHPEWQEVRAGSWIRAVPRGWLGGRFDDSGGWRVARVDYGRALVLEGWGAFVLQPVDEHTTRLIIRTRGKSGDGVGLVALGPVGAYGFEPIHFLMQRRMMLGIKSRAEQAPGTDRNSAMAPS